jgi:predicted AlkP superfamily pyrophosphatase or phosphodiesterase
MSFSTPVLPDYGGANLTGLVPAFLAPPAQRPEWLPAAARQADQVVLLVVDGLGWLQMEQRRHLMPRLSQMSGGPITTVVPSTTAAALTSVVVGAPPASHGIVGYRVVVETPSGAEVMNVLKWRTPSGDARQLADPRTFQVLEPFSSEPVPVVSKADFAGTAFTEAHQRGARQVGWFQASSLAVEVRALAASGERLVYAYYDGVDRIAHIRGFGDHYDAELVALDRIVGDLIDGLPKGVVLVVTADHGQVDVGSKAVQLASRLIDEVSMVSGEARFRWLHTKSDADHAVSRLAGLARDIYGHQAWVATLEQVDEEGWLGGPIRREFRARLGDVALVPFEPVAYLDRAEAGDFQLACRHGSLTAEEMLVPLVAQEGRLFS